MSHVHHTDAVRRLIKETFQQFGAHANAPVDESILIREGNYCGRRFDCEGLRAVWFIEEHQIKYFDRDGRVMRCERVEVDSAPADQQHVA